MKLVFFLFCAIYCQSITLAELRVMYVDAATKEENAEQLFDKLSSVTEEDSAILNAYKGAAYTLKAKHEKGVKGKLSWFKQGKLLLENALLRDTTNIEIRCLRLGIQENTPRILGYKKNIEEDKNFIMIHYKEITNSALKEYIKGFVLHSKSFSSSEKETFH